MSEIKINDLSNLQPAGAEFFSSEEGYLANLSENEMDVWGGARPNVVVSVDNKNGEVSIQDSQVSIFDDASVVVSNRR